MERAPSELLVNLETSLFRDSNQQVQRGTLRAALDRDRCQWRFFLKQSDLLDCFERDKHLGLMPFVFHHAVTGRRQFVLVHPLELLHRTLHKSINYFYEIIADQVPVKLYLDLEYSKKENPEVNGDELTEKTVKLFLEHLNERLGLKLDGSVILDLDSSSEIKFSRHVIFNTMFTFKNNLVVGEVVKHVTKNGQLAQLQIRKKDNSRGCFVDLGVYTRNRHFRLLGSKKFGGEAPLNLRGINWESCSRLEKESLFLNSLVGRGGAPVLDLPLPQAPLISLATVARSERDVIGMVGSSELPAEVDTFFERLLEGVGVARILRYPRGNAFDHVVYSSKPGGVCGNKGVAHQRHRVLWVLAPRLGTFHQKCGDQVDCPNYRSPRYPLPTPLVRAARPPLDAFEKALSFSGKHIQDAQSLHLLRRKSQNCDRLIIF